MIEFIIVTTILWMAAGFAIDHYLRKAGLDDPYSSWDKKNSITEINELFCRLFDAIYGPKMWSRRRVISSVASTILGLIFFGWLIGPERSQLIKAVLEIISNPKELFDIISGEDGGLFVIGVYTLAASCLNFIPDFISLQETRFVINHSKSKKGLLFYIILDIFLTTFVFFAFVGLGFLIAVWGGIGGISDLLEMLIFVVSILLKPDTYLEIVKISIDPDGLLLFLMTTFFTSFLWVSYICAVLIFNFISSRVPKIRNYFESAIQMHTAGRSIALLFSILTSVAAVAVNSII